SFDRRPANSSKESAKAHSLVTSVYLKNLIVLDLLAIKQIYNEHIQKLDAKNNEYIQKLEAKNKVKMKKIYNESKKIYNKSKVEIKKIYNEYIQKLEAKNKEHKEEIVKLIVKQKNDESNFIRCSEEVFKLRKVCNIRSALEYIHDWTQAYI
ncbi:15193_t:CDS:2, partial [Dentiscutata heterogama]